MSRTRQAMTLVALAGAVLAWAPAAVRAAPTCTGFGPVESGPAIANAELVELSGLTASHRHPGVLWAHNDSGDAPRVFALDEQGADLGAYVVEGAEALDWEDVAVGPGPEAGRSYLYVGDIGDNAGDRASVTVYRVPEPGPTPDGAGGTLAGTEALTLTYPDGPSDAEALLVDPLTGDLVILTKSILGASRVLTAPADQLSAGAPIPLQQVGVLQVVPALGRSGLPGTFVTAADVSPDGSRVLVRTYQDVLAFERPPGTSLAATVLGPGCSAPTPDEPQGEAIAFVGDGTAFVTASEVQRSIDEGALPPGSRPGLSRVAVGTEGLSPPDVSTTDVSTSDAPTSIAATTSPAVSGAVAVVSEAPTAGGGRSGTWWLAVGVAVLVAAGLAGWALGRRRSR